MDGLQGFLTILLGVELFVITACIVLVSYFLIRALRSISNTVQSFNKFKSIIPIPALLVAILGKIFKKRG